MENRDNSLRASIAYEPFDIDELTGVLNREAVMRSMDEYLRGAGKVGTHALLLIDIDNMQAINDELGRRCGDQAIRNIAQTTAMHFRKNDIVGRFGGDEFAVLVKNVSVEVISRKVRELLNNMQFVLSGEDRHCITSASAGIVMCGEDSFNKKCLNELYDDAKKALTTAKGEGKNTYIIFGLGKDAKPSDIRIAQDVPVAFDLHSLLNNLRAGIVIFHGETPERLEPVFCNVGYLQLSNLNHEQFKHSLSKEQHYSIHPDDFEEAKAAFAEAYLGDGTFQHTMRMEVPGCTYRWFTLFGSIQQLASGGFDLYAVFTDADKDMREKELDVMRYGKFIEDVKNKSADSLTTMHFNLTKGSAEVVYRTLSPMHAVVLDGSVDDFINSAAANVAYDEERAEFLRSFNCKALFDAVDVGVFSKEMQVPIRLSDSRVVWCYQTVDCSKNPVTGDLEAIMRLVDADVLIRVSTHYERILLADYEFVAEIDTDTGLMTIISEINDRGTPSLAGNYSYTDNIPHQMRALVEDEFVEEALHELSLDRVRAALEKEPLYTRAFPAKKALIGRDGAFQWRFGYADKKKRVILFTRREMMGFLDRRQQAQVEESIALQINPEQLLRRSILIADDVEMNREMLKMIFEEDFNIIEAADGEEAIRLIDENYQELALIMLDLQMPKKTGLDVLIHLKMRDLTDVIPVMMVTGSISIDANLRSLEYGIADIINKPFDSKVVKRRALNLMKQYAHKEDMERQLEQWKQEAMQLHMRTAKNNELLINALSSVVEFRSLESGLHINRVRRLTEILLKTWTAIHPEDHFDKDTISQISLAATLHDIGKVAIPDCILMKPGRLSKEEFEEMKKHTLYGCEMLEAFKDEDSEFYHYCYDICRYHHERSDGCGYPDGLIGEQIPIWAQIVSIADVFDALISPRVYKAAYPLAEALRMIAAGECGVFSDKLLACFEVAKEQIVMESVEMAKEEQKKR